MHSLQKLFQELVHCDRMTCKKKKKKSRDGGRHFAIKLSRSCLQWETNRQPGISRQPLPMLHQHLKTAHIWDTVSIPCGGHFKQKCSQLPGAAATQRHPWCGRYPLRGATKQGPSSRCSGVAQKLARRDWRHKYGTSAEQVADFLVQVAEEVHV